ncbi:MAG: YrbL family protein [Gammaproteobacteria bacterium]
MTVILSTEAPFARGGNRLCFVHPDFPDRVIKVQRPDFPLESADSARGFPKPAPPVEFR